MVMFMSYLRAKPEGLVNSCRGRNSSHTGFPFVRIDSNWRVRCWETESAGGSTFAVGEQRILLYGGYRDERTACKLFKIGDKNMELLAHVSLVLPTEVELSKSTVIGRDTELHVLSGDDW